MCASNGSPSVDETGTGYWPGCMRSTADRPVRDDVVRVKISRGRAFDETPPTYAVCVDPLAEPSRSLWSGTAAVVRLRTTAMVVSLGLDPFRWTCTGGRQPGCRIGSRSGWPHWAYATLNDAFTIRRRCRREDAIYGLGEKTGRHNRMGRTSPLWNTDVLDPYTTLEFTCRCRAPG
jgi:alpha-glucosidase